MTSAREEMRLMSRGARRDLARNFHNANKSMGRVGLSYARRHPALLLGGGALLGAAVVAWIKRPRTPDQDEAQTVQISPAPENEKQQRRGTWSVLLKSALRMWLVDHLAGMLAEKDAVAGAGVAAREETVGVV